ncbi:MAG: DNA-deoxyinosine glycosylase [Bacilli bacterium]|nr:DNA-deoxyinosine glycosylase [Bacilli bacterium]
MIIVNPLKPIYNKNSKILILGSFPSLISRRENFYYANKNNRFWKIFENIYSVKLVTLKNKINFLLKNKIALWDVIYSCEINNSTDSTIKNVVPNNINIIIKNSNIKHIFITGKTALRYYKKFFKDVINLSVTYLPSPSSANATYSLDKLVEIYKNILVYL